MAHQKRLSAPKSIPVPRKKIKWIVKTGPGPHPKSASIPLSVLIRDILGLAKTGREAKKIIKAGDVLIDRRVIKNHRFPVGFMDTISIPKIEKYFRAVFDEYGRIKVVEINEEGSHYKLVRINGKTTVKGGKMQLNLHDGRNILVDDAKSYKVGDVLKISLPDQKILEHLPLKENYLGYVIKGSHAGEIGRIKSIVPGTMTRKKTITLEREEEEFTAPADYIFVIGKEEPMVIVK